jgi:hypothetical protein
MNGKRWQGFPERSRRKKKTMMRGAWIEIDVEVSRLAQSKPVHPSTGRTDLLLQGSD